MMANALAGQGLTITQWNGDKINVPFSRAFPKKAEIYRWLNHLITKNKRICDFLRLCSPCSSW